ncbi:MAG: hypothetical protein ACKVJN_01925, partial [Woeseiales bacterium]
GFPRYGIISAYPNLDDRYFEHTTASDSEDSVHIGSSLDDEHGVRRERHALLHNFSRLFA